MQLHRGFVHIARNTIIHIGHFSIQRFLAKIFSKIFFIICLDFNLMNGLQQYLKLKSRNCENKLYFSIKRQKKNFHEK